MTIALSHGGQPIYESAKPSDEVLVGTNEGVVRIQRSGSGWTVTERTLTDLHIHAVLVEPKSGLIFAGAQFGSVHVSLDGGHNWSRSDKGLTEKDVYSLTAVDREDGTTRIYLGTEPAKLYFSDDFGQNWTELPSVRDAESVEKWRFPAPPHVAHLKHIDVHPENTNIVYASIEVGALLHSTDAGKSWREITPDYPDIHRCVIHPHDASRLYVTGGNGLYVSSNGGDSWEHWSDRDAEIGGYPDQLVFLPSNPDLMFIAAGHKSPGSWRENNHSGTRFGRSRDGGRTWEVLGGGLPDRLQGSVEAMFLEEAGSHTTIMAATSVGEVWCSEDLGDTWNIIVNGLAPISKGDHYKAMTPALA